MLAINADILALDFETTGAYKDNPNLPWQLGAIRILNNTLETQHAFSVFLHVPASHEFNPYAPGRWASIRDVLQDAPSLTQLWPQLHPWFTGRVLLAHNAPTEQNILNKTFPCNSFDFWLDTLTIARYAYPNLPSYKLEDLIPTLGLLPKLQETAPNLAPHDAFYDACASALLLQHILGLPGWDKATIDDLQRL